VKQDSGSASSSHWFTPSRFTLGFHLRPFLQTCKPVALAWHGGSDGGVKPVAFRCLVYALILSTASLVSRVLFRNDAAT